MGYNTIFKGELKFKNDITPKALAKLNGMLGEDFRDHPDWNGKGLYYVDLLITKDFTGVRWDDGAEKTYDLEKIVMAVIAVMRRDFPDFALTGSLTAQGEDAEDRWDLVMDKSGTTASKKKVAIPGTKIKCPSCEHTFYVDDSSSQRE